MKILRETDKKNEFFLPGKISQSLKRITPYKSGKNGITKKRFLFLEESLLYIQDTQYLYGNKFKGHYTSYYITDTNILCHLYIICFPKYLRDGCQHDLDHCR